MLLKLKIAREKSFSANQTKYLKKNPHRYYIQYICFLDKKKNLRGSDNAFQAFEHLSHGKRNSLCIALE